jgi:hypothetical protein
VWRLVLWCLAQEIQVNNAPVWERVFLRLRLGRFAIWVVKEWR